MARLSPHEGELLLFVVLAVFFFAPVVIFVAGVEYFNHATRDLIRRSHWVALGGVGIRGLHWLLGVGLAFAVVSFLHFLASLHGR